MAALARLLRRLSPWHRGWLAGLRYAFSLDVDVWREGYEAGFADGRDGNRERLRSIAHRANRSGRQHARREVLDAVRSAAERMADESAVALVDDLERNGYWQADEDDLVVDVAGMSNAVRDETKTQLVERVGYELGLADMARSMYRTRRGPTIEDALRRR